MDGKQDMLQPAVCRWQSNKNKSAPTFMAMLVVPMEAGQDTACMHVGVPEGKDTAGILATSQSWYMSFSDA